VVAAEEQVQPVEEAVEMLTGIPEPEAAAEVLADCVGDVIHT
jgi:hypothetical protein